MNEIIIIQLNWWQLGLFTMVIFFYGAFACEFLPRLIKRLLDKLEGKETTLEGK